ncbi:hypothetical protein DPMN_055188 [Dreissena polymorpha]|uniref:Uncharacterized protein n=1 Tax=Dreissena polymorpha TaxID=45954 RepID=A0A9D4HQF4_DREPO|nr:hypothetical protein DPMN_055188 [Dreissena polymorpha]
MMDSFREICQQNGLHTLRYLSTAMQSSRTPAVSVGHVFKMTLALQAQERSNLYSRSNVRHSKGTAMAHAMSPIRDRHSTNMRQFERPYFCL